MKRLLQAPLRRLLSFLQHSKMTTMESMKFDNLALKSLPIDPEKRNFVRTVNAACFSKVQPTPVENPKVVAISTEAMALLDLPDEELEQEVFADYFSGNKILPGSEPASHCYCGHQFGYFSGQLGDGAAIYLGEVVNAKNERWEIQLKGAGPTPYSRTADGRKVLRSSIREFLCSEAMHFLGIPTSRAGACITSDTKVIRDIFYNGHPRKEKCSIVLRIAPTFIRFGSFEIFKTLDQTTGRVGPSVGRTEILHTLLQYVIKTFYPEIDQSAEQVQKYAAFFKEVVLCTARLVALWQSVGFCHGVLNTDNMSIVGLTIDYGPFGFLDLYDPNHICNASDDGGRYSFIKQPEICLWNLKKLAEAIQQALPLDVSTPLLQLYEEEFQSTYLNRMREKLGIIASHSISDKDLIDELFITMEKTGADFTNTFLSLSLIDVSDSNQMETSMEAVSHNLLENCYPLEVLLKYYKPDLGSAQIQTFMSLANADPEVLDQLGRAGFAVRRVIAQLQKYDLLEKMTPETKLKNDRVLWTLWLKRYKERLIEDLNSFGKDSKSHNCQRLDIMHRSNPRFILRNYIAQEAIERAESGDFSEVKRILQLLKSPYEQSYSQENKHSAESVGCDLEDSVPSTSQNAGCQDHYDKPPNWAFSIKVS